MDRTTLYTFLVYPESAKENWIEALKETLLPIAISPLHDRDINITTGEVKKAHFHVLVKFPFIKTQKQAQAISDLCSGVLAVPCLSEKGAYEYWTHQNDTDKFQYSEEDRTNLNGYTLSDKAVEDKTLFQIFDTITQYGITTFQELTMYFRQQNDLTAFKTLARNAYFFSKFLK